MPRRSRDRRTTQLTHLQAKLDAAVARTGCRKLIHVKATLEQWKTLPKPPRPTATTFDAEEEFA